MTTFQIPYKMKIGSEYKGVVQISIAHGTHFNLNSSVRLIYKSTDTTKLKIDCLSASSTSPITYEGGTFILKGFKASDSFPHSVLIRLREDGTIVWTSSTTLTKNDTYIFQGGTVPTAAPTYLEELHKLDNYSNPQYNPRL